MSGLEISSKIIDSLLAAKETVEKIHLEFFKKRVTITRGYLKQLKRVVNLQRGDKEDTKGNFSAKGGLPSSKIVCL